MDDQTLHPPAEQRNEDYTGSLCWLFPKGEYTIIDVDTIPLVESHDWYIAYESFGKYPRVVRTYSINKVRQRLKLHRVILQAARGQIVDHRNLDTRDNRRSNLRLCTSVQNSANTRPRRDSSTGVKGVLWLPNSKKWAAKCCVAGRRVNLGSYPTVELAKQAYNTYAADMRGEYAYLNPA